MELGTTLDGKFVVINRLGKGRFSEVFRGTSVGAKARPVAIKVLRESLDDSLTREVFEREVESLRMLRHENVVEFLAHGETSDGYPYLITEYCEHAVEPARRWDSSVLALTESLLSATQQAHAQGIIHRDIKPQHLLRRDVGGPIKVIDFGIASIRRRLPTGVTLATHHTPGYACDEQIVGKPAKPQFDLYSTVACVLWYLTGRDPDQESSLAAQLNDRSLQIPTAFRELLARLTDVNDSTMTAGTALRELQQISKKWQDTEEYHLIIRHEVFARLAAELQVSSNDQVAICEEISRDLEEWRGTYPCLLTEKGAEDPEAFQQYGYRLVGRNYVWRVRPHESGRALVVHQFAPVSADEADGLRQLGLELPIDWFVTPPRAPDSHSTSVRPLCVRVIEFEKSRQAERESTKARLDLVDSWENVFRLQRQLMSDPASSLEYTEWEDQGEIVRVSVANLTERFALWQPDERLSMSGRSPSEFLPIGTMIGAGFPFVFIRKDEGRDLAEVAARGRLAPDRSLQYSALRKQQDALSAVRKGTSVNPALPQVLCGLAVPEATRSVTVEDWFHKDLDAAKRTAVSRAISAEDVMLIQGPPGTGKTVAIAELVLQILQKDRQARILLVSQSNVALDQAIEKIVQLDPQVALARIARVEDKVSDVGKNWLLRPRTSEWRSAVLARSRAYLDSMELDPATDLSIGAASQLFEEIVHTEQRIRELEAARMPILGRLSGESRRGDVAGGSDVRDELELLDEELTEHRQTREIAAELLREFFGSHGVVVEGPPHSWGEHLQAVGAALALNPRSGLAGLWDEWRRQFGRGLPYEAALARRSRILAGTCLGAASHPAVSRGEFDWVIVDESGRATSPEILVPLLRGKRAVLVGDHHQLPPVLDRELTDDQLESLGLTRTELERSLFQQLFETLPLENKVSLTTQYRMTAAIASLVSEVFYDGALVTGPRDDAFVPDWPERRITWLSTSKLSDRHEVRRGTSYFNPQEATITRGVLEQWQRRAAAGGEAPSVGVIAGYDEHRRALERELDLDVPDKWDPLEVEVNTVDAFQGRERDLLIYNTVRSNQAGQVGFLSDVRRINVAFSRGREMLVIVGDADMLRLSSGRDGAAPFKKVLDWIRSHPDSAAIINMTEKS